MKMKFFAGFAVAMMLSGSAFAVDNIDTVDSPDLAPARAKIDAKDYSGAIQVLMPMIGTTKTPDVFNLLGFSYRKSGDLANAATYYGKALDFDPNFKPTLEYQGEMYLQQGDLEHAKANLAKLTTICPDGCDEREDLEKAISDYKAASN